MENIRLNSWAEFIRELEEIKSKYGTYEFRKREFRNQILFRGQADESWLLQTTLERMSDKKWTIMTYMNTIHSSLPQLESYLNSSWNIPTYWPTVRDKVIERINEGREPIPYYEYWAYLRHNGYPSPLLDWSASPYIAAFFAFEDHLQTDRVAIYAYIEKKEGTKFSFHSEPRISVQGPYVKTHKRHFLQQSWYTIAHQKEKDDHVFMNHETVFENPEEGQDILIKLTIPLSERLIALKELQEYNINRYSLFQTEESLVKTLAMQELEMRTL